MIELNNISKKYGDQIVLDGFSYTLDVYKRQHESRCGVPEAPGAGAGEAGLPGDRRNAGMKITVTVNGRKIQEDAACDLLLIDFLRAHGCLSVKRGCETSNCGLCTVMLDGRLVLSCSVLAVRADGRRVETLEGLQEEAEEFGAFIADQGAEQCGFCNPGLMMNAIALFRENPEPEEEEIKEYLAGNLCRCSGYEGPVSYTHLCLCPGSWCLRTAAG